MQEWQQVSIKAMMCWQQGCKKKLAGWPSVWQLFARTLAEGYKVGSRVVKKGFRFGKLLPLQTRRKTMRDYS
jgi:hypothetical protein